MGLYESRLIISKSWFLNWPDLGPRLKKRSTSNLGGPTVIMGRVS